MKVEAKIITMMSIIDENLARIFLQETPLKEAIEASIDLSAFQKRVEQLEAYSSSVMDDILADKKVDLSFLKEEIKWSLCQCDKYLKMLVPTTADTNNLTIKNPRTVLRIIINYKNVLARMLHRITIE